MTKLKLKKYRANQYEKPKWIREDENNPQSDLYLTNPSKIDRQMISDAYKNFINGCAKKPFRKKAKEQFEKFLAELNGSPSSTSPKLQFYSIQILSSKTFCNGANQIKQGLNLWDSLFCVQPRKQFYTQWTRGNIKSSYYGDGWKAKPQHFDAEVKNWWSIQQHKQGAIPKKGKDISIELSEQDVRSLSLSELSKRARGAKGKPSTIEVESKQYERNPYVVEYVKRKAKGKCQLCEKDAPFKTKDGRPYLECHHIKWLAKDGDDCLKNAVALCPNCHRKMHIKNSKKDRELLLTNAKALASKPVLRLK